MNMAIDRNTCPSDQLVDATVCNSSGADQRARAARAATLGEMTEGIVHDFRNILATVESGLRLAETNYDKPEKARAFISEARHGLEHGRTLASQLLTFAKAPELELQACDVNILLRNLDQFLKCGVGPGKHLVLSLTPNLPDCLVDPSQFAAAVLNLVVNARDAIPDGGKVQISTEAFDAEAAFDDMSASGTHVRVRVADNGLGIKPEVLENIFDPFFTTKAQTGTGLGLSQVCACMRLHGGQVKVVSAPGKGTAVDLVFPASRHEPWLVGPPIVSTPNLAGGDLCC